MLICLDTSAGGYIPSSSAADDYMAQLKGISQRKNREQEASLSGREIPAEGPDASGAMSDEVRAHPSGTEEFGVTYDFCLVPFAGAVLSTVAGLGVKELTSS